MTDVVMEPIPVRVIGGETEKAAAFGVWVKHVFGGTETAPVRILPQDNDRKRAVIVVKVAGAAGLVYIGSSDKVQDLKTAQLTAGELANGATVTSESSSEQYVLPDGTNAATVSVLVERYLS